MVSLDLTDFLLLPAACVAGSAFAGMALAYGRTRGRSAAWFIFDALILLPAFLPAHPLVRVLRDGFGKPPFATAEFWPLVAIFLVSVPFAYLPARIAFAPRSPQSFYPIWPALALGTLLATARALNEFATEIFSDVPALLFVAIPTLGAAILVVLGLKRLTPQN